MDSEDLGQDVPVKIVDPFLSKNIEIPSELPYLDKCGKRILNRGKNTNIPKREKRINFVTKRWNYFTYRRKHRNQTTMSRLRSLNANRGDKTSYHSGIFSNSDPDIFMGLGKDNSLSSIDTVCTTLDSNHSTRTMKDITRKKTHLQVPDKLSERLDSRCDHFQDVSKILSTSTEPWSDKINPEEKTRRHSSNVNPAIMINGTRPTMSIEDEKETKVRRHSSGGRMLHANVSQSISYV